MRLLRIVVVGAVLLLAYPAWLGLQIWQQSRIDENKPADAIVVLGAAQYDGDPSPIFEARLKHAAFLFNEGLSRTVVVTGGKQEGDRFTEAAAGELYLVEEQGLPADRIIGEGEGRSTLESLRGVWELADDQGIETVLLVSDPMHSERIKRIANDLGFEEAYASWASYEELNRTRATKLKELLHEIGALLSYEILDR